VLRRLAGDDPEVNEEWNCDKGRWAFNYATQPDVLTTPLVRDADGTLQPASWSHAIVTAAQGLEAARGRTGVLVGGRATWEDAYAYSKFARITLDTNDIDFRARPHSAEEAGFLAARVAGRPVTVSYSDLESAPAVVLVGFEPEDESPIVFLRLRKAARKHRVQVYAVAPFATRALTKMSGRLLKTVPGTEAAALDGLATGEIGDLLATPGAVIMVGERLATVPGGLSAAARLADATGARLAWVPRRAGERGALEAGALAPLLPGGRPVADDAARAQVAAAWNVDELPSAPGRDVDGILAGAADGSLGALLVGGIEPGDFADPDAVLAALDAAGFVVSLELRHSAVTERADVVFPVAPTTQKSGAFVNWEGRYRGFAPALHGTAQEAGQSDHRVLDTLADEMGVYLGATTVETAREEMSGLGAWDGKHAAAPQVAAPRPAEGPKGPEKGQAVLTGWRLLLDEGRMQDGEPHLAGTARKPLVRLSADTAAEIGAADGDNVTVSTSRGSITLPLTVTDMPDRVVWLPLNSPGSAVHRNLGVTIGSIVKIGVGS
jgi:NADH-quinone oxidoreductase subunit G